MDLLTLLSWTMDRNLQMLRSISLRKIMDLLMYHHRQVLHQEMAN